MVLDESLGDIFWNVVGLGSVIEVVVCQVLRIEIAVKNGLNTFVSDDGIEGASMRGRNIRII